MSIPGKSDSELQAFVAALQALSAQHGIAIDGLRLLRIAVSVPMHRLCPL